MKKNVAFILCFLMLFPSCIDQLGKNQSLKDTLIAEDLMKKNLSYTDTLNDTNRKGFEKAMHYLNKAIEEDSLNRRAYQDKQTNFINLCKEIDTATVLKILHLQPKFAEEYVVLGGIYERLKRIESAKGAYEKAKSIYLNRSSSDGRNLSLIVTEFLISHNKNEVTENEKLFPIQNPALQKSLPLIINDIEKNRSNK